MLKSLRFLEMVFGEENKIRFHFEHQSFYFPHRIVLKNFLLILFKKEGFKVKAINYVFCTDRYLLQLNQTYLKHNTYTDIITFGLSEKNQPLIADIYISVERVKENALLFQTSFLKELHRIIFHGALHLCGYKDKRESDVKMMRFKEDYYLSKYFVPRETKSSKS